MAKILALAMSALLLLAPMAIAGVAKVDGVESANIAAVSGVAAASIASISGVAFSVGEDPGDPVPSGTIRLLQDGATERTTQAGVKRRTEWNYDRRTQDGTTFRTTQDSERRRLQ